MRTFRDFMEDSLYGEGGYYQRRTPKEDFYTAPELHPAFGRALSRELAVQLERLRSDGVPGPYSLVELGCGDGTLFKAVLGGLRSSHPGLAASLRFILIDRSDKARSAALDAARAEGVQARALADASELEPFAGAAYSNELLDAIPFHILEKSCGVVWEVLAPGEPERLASIRDPRLGAAAAGVAEFLQEGQWHAACPERLDWLALIASKLRAGALVSVDYGRRYPAQVPVPVKTYRGHERGEDPFAEPGSRDITAPVDFEPLIREGERLGLKTERFETMGRFLLERGLMEALAAAPEGAAGFKERGKLKTLIHPEGMGEIFKVLIQTKGLEK